MNDLTPEVKTVALNLMEGLSCPRSLSVAILIRHGMWVDLAQLSTDPLHYSHPEDYWAARAASDFLRKFVHLPTGINTEAAAIEKWWDGERECKLSNLRLDSYLDPAWGSNDTRINDFFVNVRKEVVTLIGRHPPNRLDMSFGPGATMSDRSRATTVADKMSSVLTLTPNSWIHLPSWMRSKWGQAHAELGLESTEISGNGYFTVPKDATTDRSCGKEPSLNAACQLPVGRAMRKRMCFSGIDLKDGQRIHRQVACAGSNTGDVATIDLSNASDTICRTLVKLLLPPLWFDLLDSLRSPTTTMPDGKVIRLEKFSSMGNGFTFELETVIFCAIARAVCKDSDEWSQITVYGDDIIAPTARFEDIIAALKFCGFTPNKRKTYGTGSFRESCGGDYFNGVAVRPFYLKEFNHEPQDYIALANGLRRMALSSSNSTDRWSRVKRAWFSCLDNLPSHIRSCRGPEGLGDAVIHDTEERWSVKTTDSIRYVRSYIPIAGREVRWEGFAYSVQFAVALYLAGAGIERATRLPNGNLTPRDPVTGYKVGWIAYS
jgi:hypothetical protein